MWLSKLPASSSIYITTKQMQKYDTSLSLSMRVGAKIYLVSSIILLPLLLLSEMKMSSIKDVSIPFLHQAKTTVDHVTCLKESTIH